MLMNRPGSDSVGYGLNVARIPRRMKAANSASCLCTGIRNGLYLDFTRGHLLEFDANGKHVDY